ncbi:MAG: Rpn family recombination-promoting nuclease/putative transposase [Hallerella porci]|uniref:Rpn family recombination-promoting nuclease/putative transposase n=1 Tax=Hallerella TaxID=2815788 RepID=UPI000D065304|nr:MULTISPECIES: Rpn family recombination-promoting nuclease/putative transposase [Hallerella]MCI5601733.1 Rpn family recombination-promoting nuclease/putative transposase [Hallerella sp.]MDY3921517.1 Rpn family recombination-promoting nuclease/putative transposase [Hallerella porci]
MNQSQSNRDHDGLFRYEYSEPKNAKALLDICRTSNRNLDVMLADVNLDTLERIPEGYNEVGERGEADVCFKAKIFGGKEINVGILMEHKSKSDKKVLEQIGRYAIRLMRDRGADIFSWFPTKAIIIYNGRTSWDPLAEYRKKERAKFNGADLPYECVLVNLADVNENACLSSNTPSAAIVAIAMKYAFNPEGFKAAIPKVEELLHRLPNDEQAILIEKIVLYLGEYIGEKTVEDLQMAWQSIGQKYGFVSAGDARRAAEKEGRAKGHQEGRAEGLAEGRAEGIRQEKFSLAKGFRDEGVPLNIIAKQTGLTINEIKAL